MKNKVQAVCHKCGKQFDMGYTGIVTGQQRDKQTCDKCAKVGRGFGGTISFQRPRKGQPPQP